MKATQIVESLAQQTNFPLELSTTGKEITSGNYRTEEESAAAFDRAIADCGHFTVDREVKGEYLHPAMLKASSFCRIDRIIFPDKFITEAGWKHGPIGIEIEASGRKLGGVICQCLDYHRAVWHLNVRPGYHLWLEWIAIWPWESMYGNLASICMQHRIAAACSSDRIKFAINGAGCRGITIGRDGSVFARQLATGLKTGHRG